jgi:phosphoenolpyruvate carboxykinase (ATP)
MSEIELEQFALTVDRIRQKAMEGNRLLDNPSAEELRVLVEKEPEVEKTIYGNFVAESEPSSRAAMFTENSVDYPFGEEDKERVLLCPIYSW